MVIFSWFVLYQVSALYLEHIKYCVVILLVLFKSLGNADFVLSVSQALSLSRWRLQVPFRLLWAVFPITVQFSKAFLFSFGSVIRAFTALDERGTCADSDMLRG